MGLGKGSLVEESSLDSEVAQILVSLDVDMPHLDLVLLVDDDVEDDLVLTGDVGTLLNLYIRILVTLVVEVFLGQDLCTVDHVWRDLATLQDTEFLLHILFLALFQSHVVDGGDTWTCLQRDMQIDLITHDRVRRDLHIREETVLPIAFDGLRDFRAGHRDMLSDRETRDACKHIILITVNAGDVEATDDEVTRRAGIVDVGVHDLLLRLHAGHDGHGKTSRQNFFLIMMHLQRIVVCD